MTFASLLAWASLLCFSSLPASYSQQTQSSKLTGSSFGVPGVEATFDYVIVGGGTAGLVVAQRLSEDADASVAVVEAGSFYEIDNGNLSQVPAFCFRYASFLPTDIQPLVDWGLLTVPQPELDGRVLHYTQGKCLGGSSGRNYMIYQRGTIGSYQRWADEVADQSFTWSNILPYFKKSVRFTPPNLDKIGPAGASITYDPDAFSSTGGPLHVSYSNFEQPLGSYLSKGLQRLGLKRTKGPNSGKLIGYSESPFTIDPQTETRDSSETSFLSDAIKKTYIQVYQQTLARKILFDANKQAIGVNVTTAGVSYVLKARKEVILSAGVFHSPQILMLSGIGPKETLQQYSIPVVSDLQVGQYLWDQPSFGISYRVKVITASQFTDPAYLAQITEAYVTNQTGPLASIGGEILAFEKLSAQNGSQFDNATLSDLSRFPTDWPEVELLSVATAVGPTNDTANYGSLLAALLAPVSRGNVTISSADIEDPPVINPNWYSSTTDQQVAIRAFKRLREWAIASHVTAGLEFIPGPFVQTDEQILAFIRATSGTIYHASATCLMGRAGDPRAVVDTKGKVYGVSGLRVVDASVFPFTPPGQPQATVYMLAEKIVDDIKHQAYLRK